MVEQNSERLNSEFLHIKSLLHKRRDKIMCYYITRDYAKPLQIQKANDRPPLTSTHLSGRLERSRIFWIFLENSGTRHNFVTAHISGSLHGALCGVIGLLRRRFCNQSGRRQEAGGITLTCIHKRRDSLDQACRHGGIVNIHLCAHPLCIFELLS